MINSVYSAVGYCRVSTVIQAKDGDSLPAQKSKIEKWAEFTGTKLVMCFSDEGLSGRSMKQRTGLLSALDAACKHKAALVVVSLSRVARSTRDVLTITDRLDKAGAQLVSLNEQLDTRTPMGRAILTILAALGQLEAEETSRRTTETFAYLRGQDRRISRHVPYGYKLGVNGKSLTPVPQEQATIKLITSMRRRGLSYREICKRLERQEVRTKSGTRKWQPAVVRGILVRQMKGS